MSSKISRACAKINLFLHVTGKRQDGYHNIFTLFVPITIFDEIKITPSNELRLICNDPEIPTDRENIIIKIDEILRHELGLKDKFIIELTKNIPTGAGLGGGSSDGASYLNLVDKFSGLKMSYEDKANLLSRVGSDTVFFIDPKPSVGEGRGEILSPAPQLPDMFFIIINPNIHISTQKIYQNKHLVLTDRNLIPNLKDKLTFSELGGIMKNDMEPPVFSQWSEVKALVEDLRDRSHGNALMSGSGSTAFAVYENETLRDTDYTLLKKKYPNYLVYKAEVASQS